MNYKFEKKEAATKAQQEKKDALAKAEVQRQKTIRNSMVAGTSILAFSAFLSFVFCRRRRETVMQNKITDSRLRATMHKWMIILFSIVCNPFKALYRKRTFRTRIVTW